MICTYIEEKKEKKMLNIAADDLRRFVLPMNIFWIFNTVTLVICILLFVKTKLLNSATLYV